MDMPITAEQFRKDFFSELSLAIRETPDCLSVLKSDRGWTNLMMKVLDQTGQKLGFRELNTRSCEYLRLDMAFYSFPKRPNDCTDNLWHLEVAIEHENHSEKWFDEWVKLCHIACGLKVLIAYHHYRNERRSLKVKVEEALALYSQVRYKPLNDSLLLILGPTSDTPSEPWRGYEIRSGTLQRDFEEKVVFPPYSTSPSPAAENRTAP